MPFCDIPRVVRNGFNPHLLQYDHRRAPLHNAKEDVVLTGPLETDVKTEAVMIKRQRCRYIPYDKEWCNPEITALAITCIV
jgi:hypothetical protein